MEENRTLLILDDEPETLRGYVDFLSPQDSSKAIKSSRGAKPAVSSNQDPSETYNILQAKTGEEAVSLVKMELAQGRQVAAGFFDVKLDGGMDGLATIQEIKKLDRDIRCVVVTAYHDRTVNEIQNLFGEEFKDHWDYLNKPFTQGEIVQKARQMITAWNREKELSLMNLQLIRSERLAAIGQVARGVGHEFGNILLRIVGKLDLSLLENDVKKIHDHLGIAMKAADRATVIVRNLQSFSKADPNFQIINIAIPIDEALSLVSHEMVKFNIKVEKKFETVPDVRIDKVAMGQVFLNLFINALHAMSKGGNLTITLSASKDSTGSKKGVLVKVKDTGCGISPDVLPKIFEYAFTTKGAGGSGLGLSVSKEIVEATGGTIEVKTEIDKGTEFSIWVPV